MKHSLISILYLILLQGCVDAPFREKAKIPPVEGEPLRGRYFNSRKIGWTITLPKGNEWRLIPAKEQKKLNASGEKELEELTGVEINDVKEEVLIGFRKDDVNSFLSNLQPFNEFIDGSYDQMLTVMHTLMKDTYKSKNIQFTHELSASRIDGVMVDKFDLLLMVPGKGKMYQHIYSCRIKDHILVMTITTDNKKDDEALLNVAYSSKFAFKE